jgi:hypothetical protein
MDQKNQMGEYLQGALAGKMIESPARVSECPDGFENFPRDVYIHVTVPTVVAKGSHNEISILVKNYQAGATRGVVTLQGEDLDRRTDYDFQAPFTIAPQQPGTCLVFTWPVPRFPAKIEWSASVTFEGQRGLGQPGCSATTRVV